MHTPTYYRVRSVVRFTVALTLMVGVLVLVGLVEGWAAQGGA